MLLCFIPIKKFLAPYWKRLGDDMPERGVIIGRVDCPANQQLCKDHGIYQYPMLFLFQGSNIGKNYVVRLPFALNSVNSVCMNRGFVCIVKW